MTDKIVVLVTCESPKQARGIARALVEHRLAACANIIQTPVESIYRWKGIVQSAKEFLLIVKTSRKQFAAVEEMILRLHSYGLPEIMAVPIAAGSRAYLAWISECVRPPKVRAKRRPTLR